MKTIKSESFAFPEEVEIFINKSELACYVTGFELVTITFNGGYRIWYRDNY